MNKSLLTADYLERLFYRVYVFINDSKIHYVLLYNDCSIRVYQSFVAISKNYSYYAGIMLNAFSDLLCSNYAGMIGWSLHRIMPLYIILI